MEHKSEPNVLSWQGLFFCFVLFLFIFFLPTLTAATTVWEPLFIMCWLSKTAHKERGHRWDKEMHNTVNLFYYLVKLTATMWTCDHALADFTRRWGASIFLNTLVPFLWIFGWFGALDFLGFFFLSWLLKTLLLLEQQLHTTGSCAALSSQELHFWFICCYSHCEYTFAKLNFPFGGFSICRRHTADKPYCLDFDANTDIYSSCCLNTNVLFFFYKSVFLNGSFHLMPWIIAMTSENIDFTGKAFVIEE